MINRVMIIVLALIFVIAYMSEAQVVTDGLIAYWTFDEADMDGDVAKDIIGGHDGTIFGDPETIEGKVNEGLEFDGSGDYIEAEIPDDLLADGATLEVWFRQEAPHGFGVMLNIGPNKAELNVDPERDGRSELWCFDSGGIEGIAGLDGAWHHAVGTVSEDGQVHYIDGVNVGRENPTAVVFDAISGVAIGQRPGRGLMWPGILDEVRVYGRPLSEEEVQQNMEAREIMTAVEPADKLAETWGKIKL